MDGAWRLPATKVWLLLVAATVLSWAIAEHAAAARLAAVSVILIAAFKVHLVFIYFMELDWKPYPWRVLFELWSAASATVILVGYWLAAS